jgi:hypothetical protein
VSSGNFVPTFWDNLSVSPPLSLPLPPPSLCPLHIYIYSVYIKKVLFASGSQTKKKLTPVQRRNYVKQKMAGFDFRCVIIDGEESVLSH